MSQTVGAGIVTAYGAAVRGGYEGTYDQFCADLASLTQIITDLTGISATAETLAEGAAATASYSNGVITIGIPKGDTGNGISGVSLISTVGLAKTYRIAFTDSSHYDYVVYDGNGIASTTLNHDYTLTVTYDDGTTWTSSSIRGARGEQGIQGIQGETGNGISNIAKTGTAGLVDTYTVTCTNGTTYTFTVTNGANGEMTATSVAPTFSTSTAYSKGDYVTYSGQLYQFTADHAAGAWTGTDATAAAIANDVSNLKTALQSTDAHALAAYPQETLTNQSIASFSDGADDIPIKELTAYIEPVQDLHGYDSPWPAGGGKNKFQITATTQTINDTTFTVLADGTVRISGTPTAQARLSLSSAVFSSMGAMIASTSTLPSGVRIFCRRDEGGTYTYPTIGATFNMDTDTATYDQFSLEVSTTFAGTASDIRVQVESGTSASAWSPYSNICPISGHTECKVVRTGKNLLDVSNAFKTDRNFIVGDPVNSGIPDGSIFLPAGDYALQTSENVTGLYVVTKDGTIKTVYDNTIATFTNPKAQAFRLIIYKSGVTIDYWDTINVWLSKGSTATAYEPFGTTYDIDFPSEAGTVYGGTLTVHQDGSGTLVVDRETYTGTIANATLLDVYNGYRNYQFYPTITHTPTTASSTAKKISNIATYRYETSYNDTHWYNNQYGTVTLIAPDGLPTATPVQFTMPLASKISFILSAEQVGVITTLLGTNNIWHSCNGNLDITYRADLAKYITKDSIQNYIKFSGMIAGVETGLTASKAYNSGDYFIIGQKLYKAIASIANGAAFTVGTNCTETTVGAELVTLNS